MRNKSKNKEVTFVGELEEKGKGMSKKRACLHIQHNISAFKNGHLRICYSNSTN